MTDPVAVALIAVPLGVAGLVRDIWIRCRTDRVAAQDRADRLAREAREEEEKRRAAAKAEEDKAAAVAEAERTTATDAAAGLLEITSREMRQFLRERDEAREDVNALRVALEHVVGALITDMAKMRRDLRDRQP